MLHETHLTMTQPLIEGFMTRNPATISPTRTLASAKAQMQRLGVRHLPVVTEAGVVGVLSERELDLVAAIAERPIDEVTVRQAMVQRVLTAAPTDPLALVARRMAAAKCGSAVVVEGGAVTGIFTTVDALVALAELALTRP